MVITCSAMIEDVFPNRVMLSHSPMKEGEKGKKIVRRFLGDECSPPGPNYYSHGHDEVFVPGACCANFRCDQF